MRKAIALLLLVLASCTVEEPVTYKQGDWITLKDGRRVVVEQAIPGGYIVYIPNKFNIVMFNVAKTDIQK